MEIILFIFTFFIFMIRWIFYYYVKKEYGLKETIFVALYGMFEMIYICICVLLSR